MRALSILSVIAALCLLPPVDAGATVPGAGWNITTSLNSAAYFGATGFTVSRAQTFAAVQGGRVESIRLRIGRTSDHGVALRLSIFAVDQDDFPTGNALMSGDFSPASIAVNQFDSVAFGFAAGESALLTAGQRYAVVMTAAEPVAESPFYVNAGFGIQATYAEGAALYSSDGQSWFAVELDIAFQVLVDETVPVLPVTWGRVKTLFR